MPRITNSSEIKMVFQKFVLRLGGRFGFILFGRGILFLFLNFHEYNGKLFKGDFFFLKRKPFYISDSNLENYTTPSILRRTELSSCESVVLIDR